MTILKRNDIAEKLDLTDQIELAKTKDEAKVLLDKVGEVRDEAHKEGFKTGRAEGMAQIAELITKATLHKEKMFEGMERDVIRLVYDIAEKILGREFSQDENAVVDLIRQALHAAIGERVVVLVHPDDLKAVKDRQTSLMAALDATKTLQVRSHDKVARYGCLIETEIGTIDAQLDTQLEFIREALGVEKEGDDGNRQGH